MLLPKVQAPAPPTPPVVEIMDEGGVVSELKTKPQTSPIAAISGAPELGEAMACGTVSSTPLAATLQLVARPLSALVRFVVPQIPPPVP
jgi:hypothetical protein